jgi:hypothetical protein
MVPFDHGTEHIGYLWLAAARDRPRVAIGAGQLETLMLLPEVFVDCDTLKESWTHAVTDAQLAPTTVTAYSARLNQLRQSGAPQRVTFRLASHGVPYDITFGNTSSPGAGTKRTAPRDLEWHGTKRQKG